MTRQKIQKYFLIVVGTVMSLRIINGIAIILNQKSFSGREYTDSEWTVVLSSLMTDIVLVGVAAVAFGVWAVVNKKKKGKVIEKRG